MKRASNGFTIVELMVAMVIFMIICAIAIPNYVSALQRTHEAVAVSFLRQVDTSEEAYRLTNDQYADTFAKLQPYMSAERIPPAIPLPGFLDGFVTIAYAEPLPGGSPQGNSGSAPGQTGSAPGQSGSSPGQSGSAPGHTGSAPGQSGSAPGQTGSTGSQGNTGATTSGSAPAGTGSPAPPDTKVYSKYIFSLELTDPMHWSCTAEPVADRLNSKFFYADQTNIIRVSIGALADNLSPQL
jgi:prepilin-type N-terminal cleavage/methylation domain-containing protein